MKKPIAGIALKIAKWVGIFIASVLLLLYLIPLLFPGTVAEQIKVFANKKLAGELNFTKSKLSFFEHFPSLTVSLNDFSLKGSEPFKNDTLVKADEVSFGINLKRLIFDNEIRIDEIYVSDGLVNVKVDKNGKANYNVYIADEEVETDTTSTGPAIRLDRVDLDNLHVTYNDESAKVFVNAYGFNYVGRGDLSEDVFDLETNALIDSLDFIYDKVPYVEKKRVKANLITRINTNSLSFILRKNELRINRLPVEFTGSFTILKEGYDIDIDATSENSRLKHLFSVLPPQYLTWMEDTKIKGRSDLRLSFKGNYNAVTKQQPTLDARLKVRKGFLNYADAPMSVSDFNMDLAVKLPSLDPEQLILNLKLVDFKMGEKEQFKASFISKGLSSMTLKGFVKGNLDLKELDRSLGLQNLDMAGRFVADISADGIYNAEKRLFPKTKGGFSLQGGWIKTQYYPNPIKDIKFVANINNQKGTFDDLKVAITPASFVFEGNPVYVNAVLSNFDDVDYNIKAKGELDIGRIYKVFAQEGLDVQGYAKADVSLKGRQSYATTGQYSKLDNRGTVEIRNIKAASELFPKTFLIKEGLFTFKNEKLLFDRFNAYYGASDFAIGGHLLNVINYFFESRGTLHGSFNVKSKLINVDEFMALEEGSNRDVKDEVKELKAKNVQQSGVVELPQNLDVSLIANADKVEYNGLILNSLDGKVGIKEGKMYLDNTTFDIIGCKVGINAVYDDESPLAANYEVHFRARDFSVQRAYKEIPMFRELITAAEKAEGIISLDYKLSGDLDGNMSPIYESVKGGGTISIRDVKVMGLKMFGGLGDKAGSDEMKNPELKDIQVKTRIENNLVHIDRFKFKVAGFRPGIGGTASLDGDLDLRIRLGLPPLGLIGIPVVVTGNHENPKIKVFSKTGEEIQESKYDERTNKVLDEGGRPDNEPVEKKEEEQKNQGQKPAEQPKPEENKQAEPKKE